VTRASYTRRVPVCTKCGQDNPDVARFCLACGSSLAAPEPTAEERKLVTVLFCDIVGSTATAEQLDPEDVRARLAPYYERARAELELFGGTVEKFIGDAVVALFGAPLAHEDDPERAVRAALALRTAIGELNAADEWLDLKIRIGVNTGEALVVLGARAAEGEGMAAGDVMNTAARLQSAAPVDGIVVGELTYRATLDAVEYRDAEPIAAKGKSEPVRIWEVAGLREPTGRRTTVRPLVGRAAELANLQTLWDSVLRERTPALALVVGAPGIGKTRLVEELAVHVSDQGSVFWGRCLPYGEGITYWPIADVLKAAAGILQSDSAELASQRLGQLLEALPTVDADELRTMATAAANLLGTASTPRGSYSADVIAQGELHWGLRRIIHLLAQRRPSVLIFEDLHWAEPTLLELLRFLVEETPDIPLFVLGTARPELAETAPEFVHGPRGGALALAALPEHEGEQLLAGLLGDGALTESTKAALLENAGGNPLFLEETVRMLADSGLADAELGDVPVPTSLQSLITARLDQLPARQKHLGQHASVVGRVFWPSAVAHLRGNGESDGLPADLDELERRDFIHAQEASTIAGELEYAFKHILIRDVAYGQLPRARRVDLHVRCAEWIGALPGGEDEFLEIVAWHLEQACLLARRVAHSREAPPLDAAVDALSRAAEKAERREGIREARRFYERALELAGTEPTAASVDLRLKRARACAQLGELRPAYDELVEVVAEAAAVGRPDVRCRSLVTLSNLDQRQGRARDARQHLDQAQPLVDALGDPHLQILSWFSWAALEGDFEAEFEPACTALRDAIGLAEEIDDIALQVEGHLRLGFLLCNMGSLAAAEQELVRCLALANRLGSRRDEARATFQLGLVTFYRGNLDEAERLNLQARDWLDRTSESYFQIQNFRALGLYALARGEPLEAERWLREGLPLALEEGGWSVLELYRYLAEALVRQGRIEDATELVAFAARSLPEEDRYARAALLVAEGIVAAAAGDNNAATASFDEGLRVLEEQRLPIELAEARLAFARALAEFGELSGARIELERARGIFKRIGAVGLADKLQQELDEPANGTGSAGPAPP
jgi:class 3 adenylate cyclase/tetratricopeptide (TPR) repeat protein